MTCRSIKIEGAQLKAAFVPIHLLHIADAFKPFAKTDKTPFSQLSPQAKFDA